MVKLTPTFAGGSPAASHFFASPKKVTKKGESAAPFFVFVFLSPLFLLTIGRRENSLSPSIEIVNVA
jgi:hypothetical protein